MLKSNKLINLVISPNIYSSLQINLLRVEFYLVGPELTSKVPLVGCLNIRGEIIKRCFFSSQNINNGFSVKYKQAINVYLLDSILGE